jgi:predicted DNA-binding antitoxin AbrB/MazE fold protein
VHTLATYPDLLACYSKGTLKLQTPLKLPEGAEVHVTVMPVEQKKRKCCARGAAAS